MAPTLTYLKPKALSKSAMAAALASEGDALESVDLGESMRDEEAFAAFIGTVNPDDFEAGEGWYRWTYQVEALNREHMLEVLQRRYAANSRLVLTWNGEEYVSEEIRELGDIKEIYIEKRGSGGVADELVIETDASKIKVISEHNIRYVLNDGEADVVRQNGSRVASPNLLFCDNDWKRERKRGRILSVRRRIRPWSGDEPERGQGDGEVRLYGGRDTALFL